MRLYADGRIEGETDLERQLVEAGNQLVAYGATMPAERWTDPQYEKYAGHWTYLADRIKKARTVRE